MAGMVKYSDAFLRILQKNNNEVTGTEKLCFFWLITLKTLKVFVFSVLLKLFGGTSPR